MDGSINTVERKMKENMITIKRTFTQLDSLEKALSKVDHNQKDFQKYTQASLSQIETTAEGLAR